MVGDRPVQIRFCQINRSQYGCQRFVSHRNSNNCGGTNLDFGGFKRVGLRSENICKVMVEKLGRITETGKVLELPALPNLQEL